MPGLVMLSPACSLPDPGLTPLLPLPLGALCAPEFPKIELWGWQLPDPRMPTTLRFQLLAAEKQAVQPLPGNIFTFYHTIATATDVVKVLGVFFVCFLKQVLLQGISNNTYTFLITVLAATTGKQWLCSLTILN